jgi:hypothetical protein
MRYASDLNSIGGSIAAGAVSLLSEKKPVRPSQRNSSQPFGIQQAITVTRIHQVRGIACTYPESWQLSENEENNRLASFTIQSPNTAFMSVYVSPEPGQVQQLMRELTELLSSEYDEVESSTLAPETLGLENVADDLEVIDLNFYYLDLLVTARLVAFTEGNRTVLVQCQAEDREFDALEMVYRAMLVSMLRAGKEKTSPDLG